MPPIRFLHAAGIAPDAVLPRLPASDRALFDAAPLAAIARFVAQAIEHRVDCLLLSPAVCPDGFVDELSLRSANLLREEFAQLIPHDIPAFLAVGRAGSPWSRLATRDTTLTILAPGESAPIADRNGRRIATLRCEDSLSALISKSTSASRLDSPHDLVVAPRLAVEDVGDIESSCLHYLGCGVGPRRLMPLSSGLAHSPGNAQALCYTDCGPHGATLVTIDGGDKVQTEFVPTASIRYESISIRTKTGEPLEDLAIRMADRLAEQRSEVGEHAWEVRWLIEASGESFAMLSDPVQRSMLGGLLPDADGGVPVVHRLNIAPHPLWPALDEPFAAEFAAALVEQEAALSDLSRRRELLGITAEAKHQQRLETLLAGTDVAAAMNHARRLGVRIVNAANDQDAGQGTSF